MNGDPAASNNWSLAGIHPMARSDLAVLFRTCLHRRVAAEEFREILLLFDKKNGAQSKEIVGNLLNCAFHFCLNNDPLISAYLQTIIGSGFATSALVLTGLGLRWNSLRKKEQQSFAEFLETSARLVTDLNIIASTTAMHESECRRCIILASRWLCVMAKWSHEERAKEYARSLNALMESVGFLLVSYLSSAPGELVMTKAEHLKEDQITLSLQQAVEASMESHPNISVQLMERTQKHPGILSSTRDQNTDSQVMEMAALDFETSINDAQIIPSRVATYVLLSSLLSSAATIDDAALCGYLNNRHSGNFGLMFNDILLASFDTLSKPTTTQTESFKLQCQIFLHNKLPSVLAFIAQLSSFESLPTEQYLIELWNDLTTLGNAEISNIGTHFLQICALHHLITAESVTTLTGQDVSKSSVKGLFPKDTLVAQVNENAARGPRLVDELIKNDGNAGTVSYALMEIIHKYCQSNQMQHLKDLVNALVRKPQTINTIAMFIRPALFLAPLCNVLDDWNWNDIHGESQPVYDEFGSILLFIVAFKARLGIQDEELGLTRKDGFLAAFLSSGHAERDLSSLTDTQQTYIGDWINALYMTEGLSDDLMATCSAKEFYMLVPTLVRQSVMALKMGKLTEETLKAGLDYMLEPCLLPSLLPAFSLLSQLVDSETKSVVTFMQGLTRSPGSSEASELHKTVMAIAVDDFQKNADSTPLPHELQDILVIMTPQQPYCVRQKVKETDLNLASSAEGGLLPFLQRATTDLLTVPSQGLFSPPLVVVATRLRGPVAVSQAMIGLLLQFSGSHDFHPLLDLVSTILAAFDSPGITLRNGVQLLHSRLGSFLKKGDSLFAEALVHLSRRVELYANALSPQNVSLEQNMMPMTGVDIANINLDAVSGPNLDTQPLVSQTEQADQLTGEDMDQMLKEAAAMGSMDQLGASMNESDMFDFGADNYDLGNLDDFDINMFT